jgi:hypothetical protein
MPIDFLITLVLYLALLILIFLLAREFALWYWKIDHAINLLERIEENTRRDKK